MNKYLKFIIVAIVLFVILGILFNLVFRFISYSFYKNAKKSVKQDNTIKRMEIGKDKDLIGYIKSTDFNSSKKTIIFFGGSGDIAYNAALKYGAIFKDYTFVSVDYAGTQESKGSMNLNTMQMSAVKLYDHIINLSCVNKDSVYVVGYSYGTGIAAYLASVRSCSGLTLVAPYRDVSDLYNAIIPIFHSPFGWFITDNINTKEYAKAVKAKTLIITSDTDKSINCKIPYSLASNFKNASVKKFKGISHETYFSHEAVTHEVKDFCK